jgi:hypothetical protein
MAIGDYKVLPFVINANGKVDTGYTPGQKELLGGFAAALAEAIPGTTAKETSKTWMVKTQNDDFFTVWDLLDNAPRVRSALEGLNKVLHQASGPE